MSSHGNALDGNMIQAVKREEAVDMKCTSHHWETALWMRMPLGEFPHITMVNAETEFFTGRYRETY